LRFATAPSVTSDFLFVAAVVVLLYRSQTRRSSAITRFFSFFSTRSDPALSFLPFLLARSGDSLGSTQLSRLFFCSRARYALRSTAKAKIVCPLLRRARMLVIFVTITFAVDLSGDCCSRRSLRRHMPIVSDFLQVRAHLRTVW
jgi:hypothetical protein